MSYPDMTAPDLEYNLAVPAASDIFANQIQMVLPDQLVRSIDVLGRNIQVFALALVRRKHVATAEYLDLVILWQCVGCFNMLHKNLEGLIGIAAVRIAVIGFSAVGQYVVTHAAYKSLFMPHDDRYAGTEYCMNPCICISEMQFTGLQEYFTYD